MSANHEITSIEQLEALYGLPSGPAVWKLSGDHTAGFFLGPWGRSESPKKIDPGHDLMSGRVDSTLLRW